MLIETKMEKPPCIENSDKETLASNGDCGLPVVPEAGQPPSTNETLSSSISERLSATGKLDYSKLPCFNGKLPHDHKKSPFVSVELPLDADKLGKLLSDRDKPPFLDSKLPSDSNKTPSITEITPISNGRKASDSDTSSFGHDKCPENGKPPEEPEDCPFNLESILCEIGSFGKYQLMLLALLAIRDCFLQMCNYNYVFTAAEVNFRCVVPECESGDDLQYNASFVQFALPNLTNTCYRLASRYAAGGNASVSDRQWSGSDVCSPAAFVDAQLVPCERRLYEDYNSLYAEFDLGCEPWKRTLIGTVHNLGLLISFLISGLISDRFGRKAVVVGSPLAVGAAGLLKSLARGYWTVLALELLEAALGYGNAATVLSLEAAAARHRVCAAWAVEAGACAGGALLAALAGRARAWRLLLRATHAPLLAALAYAALLDESVRWLVAHGRHAEAARVLHKMADYNNVTLSRRAAAMLQRLQHGAEKEPESTSSRCELFSSLRSRKILLRVLLLAACFMCCLFVYSGSIIYSTSFTGDRFVNFAAMWAAALCARALAALAMWRCGRRAPLAAAYGLCAAAFLASAAVPPGWVRAATALYALGAACASFGVFALTVFALELLPTRARNSLLNAAGAVGRVGSVLAPQAPLLARVWAGLPQATFAAAALCAGALCVLLPDTSRAALPDRVADAESLPPASSPPAARRHPRRSPPRRRHQLRCRRYTSKTF